MLIGAALALLAILLGGPSNDLLILKLAKPVKQEVVDLDKKEEILNEIKAVKKLSKTYNKKTKVFTKELRQLAMDQSTDKAAFDAFYATVVEYEIEANKSFIPHRIAIQENMSQEEWDAAISSISKAIKKSKKTNDKILAKYKKTLDKFDSKIRESFENQDNSEKAGLVAEEFSTSVYDLVVKILEYDQSEEEVLLSNKASYEDLEALVEESNEEWVSSFVGLSSLHTELAALATADEWKHVAKELKKII